MPNAAPRPSWQRTDCPTWCRGGHAEEDLPGDRVHRSAGIDLDVRVRRLGIADGELWSEAGIDEFVVGLARWDGEETVWLYVGSGPGQQIELDARDAPDLLRAVARSLG